MEKKSTKSNRRRPPNLNLKASTRHLDPLVPPSNRENEDMNVIQPTVPIFASVHRPRHASISAIKRDNQFTIQKQEQQQQQSCHRSTFRPIQQYGGTTYDSLYMMPEKGDNGNSGLLSVGTKGPSRVLDSNKQSWQGMHHHHQHHLPIAVAIPQPFHQKQQQDKHQQSVTSGPGTVPATIASAPPPPTSATRQLQYGLQQAAAHNHLNSSRIPMPAQQNFNQISKTATNLLNDIYEKHLLSQTTFENVTMLNNRPSNGVVMFPMNMSSTANISFGDATSNGVSVPLNGDLNLNNLHQHQQHQQKHQHQQFIRNLQSSSSVPAPAKQQQYHHQQQQQHQPPNNSNHHLHHQSHQLYHGPHQVGALQPEPQNHLYETVDPPPPPAPCSAAIPNRIPRKRIPGKIQKSTKTVGGADSKQGTTSLSNKKHVAGDENYSRVQFPGVHQQQQQQQQQQQSQHLFSQGASHPHHQHRPAPPYNHLPRTRADGENFPNDASSNKNGTGTVAYPLHPPLPAPPVQQDYALERPTNFNPGMLSNGMQPPLPAIRSSCGAADGGDTSTSAFVEHFQEFNGPHHNIVTAKYQYRNSKIDLMLETAQAMAAAAYYARAAQKLAQNGTSKSRSTDMSSSSRNGGFCGALQRAPPPMPAGLVRRLANKENYGIGRVKVMLRVSDSHEDDEARPHFMAIDKKKRQVTLTDPATCTAVASTSQERGPMVAAPKMFAFDNLFTADDQQSDVCASALSEVIPAVLEGSDGCLLTIGYPSSGQSRTMLGSVSAPNDLGAIPCAISWLYKGINERRQKSGARFSVRVSALGVSATKPDSSSKDLLAAHATDSDDSPGVYLRDDFLGGPTELRAPTAERAALFLDAALAGRPQSGLEPAMIFTLHVYQYSLSGKGGVAGGRSRLHLIDLGGCANRNGGLPLSGIGNFLLAILSGQRHPPNKDHPLTPLLKDCLAPLTCHVTILAHVAHSQTHTDALTTIQLASRIHRMRRRKHRFPISSDKTLGMNAAHQSGGSSEGPDPSSSDLSADTVIYMGPCDDATDGEHPPVYLPSLSSGDNRCAMKVLKGSCTEKPSKIPAKKGIAKPQSPIVAQRTDSIKRANVSSSSPTPPSSEIPSQLYSPVHGSPKNLTAASSPKIAGSSLRHPGISKGSNVPSPKSSPLRRPNIPNPESPMRQISEEQWIDGPRVSRSKVAEARHLLREINHVKQCETWIDGPKSASPKSLTVGNLPNSNQPSTGYGFMDNHKKTMIRQWVENQSSHVFQTPTGSPTHQAQQTQSQSQQQIQQQMRSITYHLTQFKQKSEDDQHSIGSHAESMVNPIGAGLSNILNPNITAVESSVRSGLKLSKDETDLHSERSGLSAQIAQNCLDGLDMPEEEDQDSGPSEVPPALPLIEPLGSREISHESLHRIISRHVSRESLSLNHHHIQTIDCGLQVTEEEIAKTMGCEHPLAALSHGDISVVSSFNIGDAFSDCAIGERTRNQFDQLARLREIFTSQLAMAEVTPTFRIHDAGSVYSEPAFRFNAGPGSVCSEPAYRPPSPRCRDCRQSLNPSRTSSQTSLPSLTGIMQIAGMEQYASLRHPDGASDPNLPKFEKQPNDEEEDDDVANEKSELLSKLVADVPVVSQSQISQLPLLPLSTSEAYDSGHDSSTPRTSKHSGISRRAESGYHSVATARDSDESSFTSAISKEHNRITMKKKRQDKSLCNWLRNPFTCTYPETEGEISDF